MSDIRVHQKSLKDIEDFLTFTIQAKDNSETDIQFWTNLSGLVEKLRATEDKPVKLASVIKQWCKKHEIILDPKKLAESRAILRINMSKKKDGTTTSIPLVPEGDKPAIELNQAMIVAILNDEIDSHSKP